MGTFIMKHRIITLNAKDCECVLCVCYLQLLKAIHYGKDNVDVPISLLKFKEDVRDFANA